MNFFRRLKNIIIGNKKGLEFFIGLVNTPIIGNIYDFFYWKVILKNIKKHSLHLTIEPSNVCNLKCIMCPYAGMKRKKEVMSMELFKKIIDQAKEMGCKAVHLQQYNEPFLDKFIFERINYIRKLGIETLLYSNGTLLDKKMRDKILDSQPTRIRISIDGAKKETFESIRKGANFEKVVENTKNLFYERNKRNQKLPLIEVYFTVLEKNKKEANEFLKFWEDKCDFATLYLADSRESEFFTPVYYKDKKSYPCLNPKMPIILSNGKVALCCVDVEGNFELGDLKKQKLRDIMNSPKLKNIYKSQIERNCNLEICKNCSKNYIDSAFKWWIGGG